MGLKVIGAGFGRTGTRSLKTALEELGFGKCYHMIEVIKHPGHLKHWVNIMNGGEADWETLFNGYQSSTDWPVAVYYKQLMLVYPEAKIILTVRDPGHWHKSIMNTFYQYSRKFIRYTRVFPFVYKFLLGLEKVIWGNIFHDKLEDKALAIKVFREHLEEVKHVVPPDRLLVFDARQGWEPLCAFLNVPVPVNRPYPHKNKGKGTRWILKYRNFLQGAALVVLFALLFLLVRVMAL